MAPLDYALITSGLLTVALTALKVAERALDRRALKRKHDSTPPDPCHDCRSTVASMARTTEQNIAQTGKVLEAVQQNTISSNKLVERLGNYLDRQERIADLKAAMSGTGEFPVVPPAGR